MLDKIPDSLEPKVQELLAQKVPGKIHFSSSPDRGLENLLYCLPWVQERVPDVKIHVDVYYGMHNLEISQPDLARKLKDLIKTAGGEGVVNFKGRIGQADLAQAWKQAYLWFYPTWFAETYCITSNEAMLSATPILCSDEAALNTTVGQWGIRVGGFNNWGYYSKEAREKFISEAVKLFNDKNHWLWWARRSFLGGLQGLDWETRYKKYWKPLVP
jgi:glycosyltransferase involved in cell wall biosynthesis